jgi:hypothetical protein
VRQRQECEIDIRGFEPIETLERPIAPGQMRMDGSQRLPYPAVGTDKHQFEARVGVNEPDELAAGIPGGAYYSDAMTHGDDP